MKILFVDDSASVLEAFQPELQEALEAEVSTILHHSQTAAELVVEILKAAPDVLLLDGYLHHSIRGAELIPPLRQGLPQLKIIGFSSSPAMRENFMKAGADAFIHKDTENLEEVIESVVNLLADGQ